ncbi:acyl carrier protein [Streptomyces sp. NPDC051577]|uniref:acyl carrier protein n=1 Tax=Streptomyces sp. NPDC051577 TaxID=3155166 RepID=UPI0034395037
MLDLTPRLRELLTSKFGVTDSQLEEDVRLADLQFDSLALSELSVACDDDLGIQVTDTELTSTMKLSELNAIVAARLAAV